MPYIEMQELSKNEKETSFNPRIRIYQKFPFFVGDKIEIDVTIKSFSIKLNGRIHCQIKGIFASSEYKSQSVDHLAKPITRFWGRDKSLANLCCESIAKSILHDPNAYADRSEILPEELNEVIDQKLEQVTQGIVGEKLSCMIKNHRSTNIPLHT